MMKGFPIMIQRVTSNMILRKKVDCIENLKRIESITLYRKRGTAEINGKNCRKKLGNK